MKGQQRLFCPFIPSNPNTNPQHESMENHWPDSRNNTRRSVAPGLCGHSLLDSLVGHGNSLYRGERILVNKWSYGLRLPFMAWLGYHRWGDKPVRKDDIIVFNNPANLKEPIADRREVFINRCIGTPGDTLLIDSLFSVVSSEQDAPDQKFLYAYPRNRESSSTHCCRCSTSSPARYWVRTLCATYAVSAATKPICWNSRSTSARG